MRQIHRMPQRSEAWYAVRVGILTASVAGDITGTLKSGKESAARRDLRTRLALERITGQSQERPFDNADMQRGRELEAEALAAYEGRSGQLMDAVGFVSWDDLPIGCSPDGALVDYDSQILGGVDVKCPRAANHLAYLKDPALLVNDYEAQMAHTLLVTGAAWWDLCSYCPQFPAVAQTLIVRVRARGAVVDVEHEAVVMSASVDFAAHELNVRQFLREVETEEAEIRRLAGLEAA